MQKEVQQQSLKFRLKNSLSWSAFDLIISQVLRFGSNLILTKLLYPEAFGLVILAQSVIIGLHMMTDIGIRTVIIQDKDGDNTDFLNTAWSVRVLQGLLIFIVSIPLSYATANYYDKHALSLIVIFIAFTSVITCLESTNIASASRKMKIKSITILSTCTYIISIIATLLLAWLLQSVWAILIGNFIGTACKTIYSHLFLSGIKNKWHINREHSKRILNFGKWIVVSSTLTFLAGEGNKLLIGSYLTFTELAIYGLALNMSRLSEMVSQVISGNFYPAFSEVYRDSPERFINLLTKSRLFTISISVGLSLIFVVIGPIMMDFLYDDRYSGAGEMLRVLSIGAIFAAINGSYHGVLFAIDKIKIDTYLVMGKVLFQVIFIVLGYNLGGTTGVVYGISFFSIAMYIINSFVYARMGLWQPKIDAPYLILGAALIYYFYLH